MPVAGSVGAAGAAGVPPAFKFARISAAPVWRTELRTFCSTRLMLAMASGALPAGDRCHEAFLSNESERNITRSFKTCSGCARGGEGEGRRGKCAGQMRDADVNWRS